MNATIEEPKPAPAATGHSVWKTPILVTTRAMHEHVEVEIDGIGHIYRLATRGHDGRELAGDHPVLVRVDPMRPNVAEVWRTSVCLHRYHGYARLVTTCDRNVAARRSDLLAAAHVAKGKLLDAAIEHANDKINGKGGWSVE